MEHKLAGDLGKAVADDHPAGSIVYLGRDQDRILPLAHRVIPCGDGVQHITGFGIRKLLDQERVEVDMERMGNGGVVD